LNVNNSYSLPDLDILSDQQDVFNSRFSLVSTFSNELLIFPLPPTLNCNGTVTAVRHCYNSLGIELGSEKLVFTLLTLEQNNGQNFTIRNMINVTSTPTADICIMADMFNLQHYCCDNLQLDTADMFDLPTSNFAFGILQSGSGDLLTYFGTNSFQYAVEHYRPGSVDITVGSTISVGSLRTDRLLTLSKFIISKLGA
jgi:hypothetical protein